MSDESAQFPNSPDGDVPLPGTEGMATGPLTDGPSADGMAADGGATDAAADETATDFTATDDTASAAPAVPVVPPKRRGGKIALAIVGVLGIGAGAAFAVTQLSGKEKANTPEEAVESFYRSVETGDFIGMAKTLAPGERDVMLDSMVPLVNELSRLEILEKNFDLNKVKGYKAKLTNYTASSKMLRPDLAAVTVTGGDFSATFDPKDLPFGDFLRDQFGKQIDEAEASTSKSSLKLGTDDSPIVVQKVGNRWYLSLNYSIAEAARNENDTPFAIPAKGAGVPAKGAKTAEEAVTDMMQAGANLDIRRMVELLPPDEFAAVHDYAGEFVPNAARELVDIQKQYSFKLQPKLRSVSLADDRRLVQVIDIPMQFTASINEQKIDVSYADKAAKASFTSAEGEDLSAEYKNNCLNLVLDGEKKNGCGRDGIAKLFTDLTGTPIDLESLPATTGGINGPCSVQRKAQLGFTVIKRDGLWYVSPSRTMFDTMTATLKTLDRSTLDCLVKETKKVIDSNINGNSSVFEAGDDTAPADDPFADDPFADESFDFPADTVAEDPFATDTDIFANDTSVASPATDDSVLLADTPACREFNDKTDTGESPSAKVIDQCFEDAFGSDASDGPVPSS